ncbi:prohead protease [Pseudanabaena phage Pan2]|nr:prohead protease [Pseudanabaena phage Pan2]
MSAIKIQEHGKLVESNKGDGRFRVRIITEGKGSSGVYTRDLLENYKDVFAGRPMFMNHPKDPNQPWERDVRDIAGRIAPQVEYAVEDGVAALYADVTVDKRWAEFVAEYQDVIGVSIYASGEGREENGQYIVESFDESDPYTSVDWVVAAGRGGRVERMLESYRQIETSVGDPAADGGATAISEDEKMGNHMDELKALIEALAESVNEKFVALEAKVDSVVTLSEQAVSDAAEKADAFEVVEELTTAVAEAKLPEEGRKRVLEAVKAGKAIAESVAAEKAYVESIRKSLTEAQAEVEAPAGRVVEGAAGAFSLTDLAKKVY